MVKEGTGTLPLDPADAQRAAAGSGSGQSTLGGTAGLVGIDGAGWPYLAEWGPYVEMWGWPAASNVVIGIQIARPKIDDAGAGLVRVQGALGKADHAGQWQGAW